MSKRARISATLFTFLVLGVLALLVARPAYADSMFNLTINGARSYPNSLADLQKALNAQNGKGSTITIDFNTDVKGGPLELPEKATITINLNSHVLDRGLKSENSKGHAMLVKSNARVTINGGTNIGLRPINSWNKNGYNVGTQVIASGLITGGYSTNKAGGIHLYGGARLTLNNVTVAGNRAEQKGGSDGYGGGIWASGSDVMVSLNNSDISFNYAYNDGGGICSTSSRFNLFMNNSKVSSNSARRDGGGIALRASKAVITGDPKSVVGWNSCYDEYGGGVYINENDASVSGFTVEGNDAKYGGGVATRNHSITLSALTITKNTAQYGGGVYIGDFTNMINTASDTMNGCTITKNSTNDNSSWGKGAGVYVVGSGRGWLVQSFSLEVGGKTIIKDNGAGSGNLVFGSTSVHPNFTLTGDSDVRMGYEKISEDAVQVTHDRLKGPNCIRYLTPENGGYHFTYNPSSTKRKIYYVRDGKDNSDKYGTSYGQRQTVGKLTSAAAAPKVDGAKTYNGWSVTRGYVRFPSVVEEKVDLTTPFFYSDGYFFDNPETYNPHLATASLCMAMSGFYLNAGELKDYTNKHASARQFMADIGCDDQSIYVNDFNVQKPGIDTIGVTIAHKRLKNKDGKDSDYYLVPVAIRGANYEAEWTSNVTLNKAKDVRDAEAAGFASAADKVYKEIRSYMRRYNLPAYKTRFWVAGYSRAGATTNLVCKRLIDAWNYAISNKPKVFGYPVEAPQGGVNINIDDRNYFSIHNVINQADLVPLVAPTAMGFKRYGVDHYIPGTGAATIMCVEQGAVTRGGTGGPTNRYLYADNQPIYSNSASYNNAGAITQLKAIDPNIVFDDYFATCGMDFAPSPSIYEKSTGSTTVYEEKFIRDFLNELQIGAISSRDAYANDLEPTFRTVMGMLFGMEPSRTKKFVDRASTTMNRFDTLIASWNDHGMLRIWWSLIGEWNKSDAAKKKEYTDLFYKKLKETEALDVLTKDERAKFDAAWPKLFDFIMRVLDRDYNNKSYNTAKMMMLGTFAYNSSRIMANHYPEVTLAWLRTYDGYYTNERTSATIANAPLVPAPSASVDKTSLKAGDQVNEIPGGKQTVKLDVTNLRGEAIYYKMTGDKTSANTCKNGYEIYRGGIDLGRASNGNEYTITAYAVSYGTKSAEVTYKIKASGATHKVVVYNERNARRNGKSQTYEWAEESQQTIEAKETENWQLDDWRVWDEQGRDVTGTVLGDQQKKKKSATFTMPKAGENGFSENYRLTFSASFKWRPTEYPKHTFTVKVGNSTETFRASECSTFKYDATNKIPAGKHFKEWMVTDQNGTDVTRFMRTAQRNRRNEDYVWTSRYKSNMSCEVTGNNQTVNQTNAPKSYTFAQGYSLTFEAQLEDVVTVNKIEITGVVEAMLYGSGKTTIKYYAGTDEVHQLYQYAGWKRSQSTKKNEDTTVTTTTTYTNYINCPAVAGKPFAADDALSITAQVAGKLIDQNSDYTVAWERKKDGTIRVTITKTETKTTGTPTFTYNVTAHACDKNDASRTVLKQGENDLTGVQSFKAGVDGVFRFYNGPIPPDMNWKFCGYEAAEGSGLEKVNKTDPRDATFKVVDKTKPLVVNKLYVPEISKIEVTQFPQPAMGEPLANKDDDRIDFAYILPGNSVFMDAFETQVKSIEWKPAPGDGQRAAANTAYTAELELECVDEDGKPYECAYEQRGVSVSTDAQNPAFESAEFDSKTSKLILYFNKTERETKHEVTVVNFAKDDTADDARPKTYSWDEGEAKSITAKSYDDYVFSGWNVTDGTNDVAEKLGLDAAALKQPTLAFVMPNKDVLGDGYQLFVMASYVPKARSLRAIVAAPTVSGENVLLANNATIKWKATEESEQREATVPVAWSARIESGSGTDTETWTYTASMRLDEASAAEFVADGITATVGPSDVEDYAAGTSAACVRNDDGSITVNVTFPSMQTAASKEDVTIEAYDANTMSKFTSVSNTELLVAWDMDDAGKFELLPPAIDGATFVGWEVPSGSKIERVGTTGNTFKFQDGATAEDSGSVRALYVPVVTSVTIAGVAAPVAEQQLTALSGNNVTAALGFSDATKTLFGANTLPGGEDSLARIQVANLMWTPEATGNEADFETEYTAAAKVVAERVKIENNQEVEDGAWRFVYANGVSVQAEGTSTTRLNAAADTAYLYYRQTEHDKYHQVSITRSTYNMESEEYVDSWCEGTTYVAVAREFNDKLFSGWTVVDGNDTDVTAKLGLSADALKSETLRITMPAAGGDFAKDYSLTITANYINKLGAITATVPQPNPNAEQMPTKATLKWGNGQDQSAEVDVWWNYESQVVETGESKTVTESYTAVMRLDADRAKVFASTVAVTGATTATGEPQVKQDGTAWTWNTDGDATITVAFNPIVTNVQARKVVAQACDINTANKTKIDGTTDEELTLFVDEENKFAVYAPEVEGAEFVEWDVPAHITKVDAPQTDPQDAADVSEDGLTIGYFQFASGAPAGQTYTIKALYKPVVDVVQAKFAAPKAGQAMATTTAPTAASFTLQNNKFSEVPVTVSALAWDPDPTNQGDGKAAYGTEYDATVTLAPAADKQFAYADDLLPDYEVPDESDEDDAAMVEYATEDPAHTMYVSFYKTEQPGLQRIVEPAPIVAANDKNNKDALKALLPSQVDIEVVGSSINKANVVWQDPVCDENGSKAYESFWHAEGTITLPEGVALPDGASQDVLKVYVPIYVMAADTLNLLDVEQPADLLDVDPDSDIQQQLPTTTTLTVEDGIQEDVEIVWDWEHRTLEEDGKDANVSVWAVTGAVKTPLPNWIVNPEGEDKVDLTFAINVYVNPPDRRHEPADPPYATLDDGVYDLSQVIYLDTYKPDATIYYNTDANADLANFVEYTRGTPIYLDRTTTDEDGIMTIQAYATEEDKDASEPVTYLYLLDEVIEVPEGKELVFDGEEQTGVWCNDNYSLLDPSNGARIDEFGDAVATNVGTYTVRARIADKLQWEIGEPDEEDNVPTTADDQIVTFTIVPASVKDCDIELAKSAPYTGKAVTPRPRVTLGDYVAVEGRDYTLAYADNVSVGKAKVTITGKGNLKDSVTLEFDIDGGAQLPTAYAGHVQTYGDQPEARDGAVLGTTGQAKRLEAFSAKVEGGSIEYRSHLQKVGWEKEWSKDGELSGTTGQARRLEAIQMRLSSRLSDAGYHVWYRVHSQTYGWQGWACDGAPAGTTGMGKRGEAIQVVVLKGDAKPEGYDARKTAYRGVVAANAHVQHDGWLGYRNAGQIGTTGQAKRMEALWIKSGCLPSSGIKYQSHLQRIGWESEWRADGAVSGTTGQARRVEAIRAQLTGDDAAYLSVWYRVHSQTFGWSGWARDGQDAGSVGLAKRAEAVEFLVLSRGADAPGPTADACRTR